jgi:hypothetical protein
MSWFRSHARLGSCLALFALAFQVAVSFGHIHSHQIASHEIAPVADGIAVSDAEPAHSAPARSHPAGDDQSLADDCCPICALIYLARALVPAEAPWLSPPSRLGEFQLQAAAEFDLTASERALFHARAPPVA